MRTDHIVKTELIVRSGNTVLFRALSDCVGNLTVLELDTSFKDTVDDWLSIGLYELGSGEPNIGDLDKFPRRTPTSHPMFLFRLHDVLRAQTGLDLTLRSSREAW